MKNSPLQAKLAYMLLKILKDLGETNGKSDTAVPMKTYEIKNCVFFLIEDIPLFATLMNDWLQSVNSKDSHWQEMPPFSPLAPDKLNEDILKQTQQFFIAIKVQMCCEFI